MVRSTRSGRAGGGYEVSTGRSRTRGACDLNETIDEHDDELMRAIEESLKDVSEADKGKRITPTRGLEKTAAKGKRKMFAADIDVEVNKENNGASLGQKEAKRKKPKGLSERRGPKALVATASPGPTANSIFESPPIFAFRQGKTALKQRKILKLKRKEQEVSERRIEELKAYFGSVDQQRLSFA